METFDFFFFFVKIFLNTQYVCEFNTGLVLSSGFVLTLVGPLKKSTLLEVAEHSGKMYFLGDIHLIIQMA